MIWNNAREGFEAYLRLEKGLSENSVEAYIRDFDKLRTFIQLKDTSKGVSQIHYEDLAGFIKYLHELGVSLRSQARIISGIKAFFSYLVIDGYIKLDPSELIEGPKLEKHLPDVLSIEEVDAILESIDLSHPQGHRNRAMIETLYACGLRVSELVGLKISGLFPDIGFIKVLGKNNKERIVPIGESALKHINIYIQSDRNQLKKIKKGNEEILFLNRNGGKLSRVMVFYIIKELAAKAGISKQVSPHIFRHSFATHMVEGGADLRAIQEMLGHESITTTEIYTHLDQSFLRATIDQFHPRSQFHKRSD
jgi:integrase/recombinase XerD